MIPTTRTNANAQRWIRLYADVWARASRAVKVEFDSRRAAARLTMMFCGTPSAGPGRVQASPIFADFGVVVISAFEYRDGPPLGDRPRQPRRIRRHGCAHDALTSPRSRTSRSAPPGPRPRGASTWSSRSHEGARHSTPLDYFRPRLASGGPEAHFFVASSIRAHRASPSSTSMIMGLTTGVRRALAHLHGLGHSNRVRRRSRRRSSADTPEVFSRGKWRGRKPTRRKCA